MTEIIAARAKINLTLHVLGRRDDGYHDLDLIFQPVSLSDTLAIRENGTDGIVFTCSESAFSGSDNLVVRAFDAVKARFGGAVKGIDVYLKKTIPAGAGLGGGSADAAALLLFLNRHFGLGMSDDELVEIGAGLGADVPACLFPHAVRGLGVGERLTHIDTDCSFPLLIIKPPYSFNTGEMYKRTDSLLPDMHPNRNDRMEEALRRGDVRAIGSLLYNIFEDAVPAQEKIAAIRRALLDHGACGSLMSGSGSAVYGVFENALTRHAAAAALRAEIDAAPEESHLAGCRLFTCEAVNK